MSSLRQHAEWLSLIEVSGPFVTMPVLLDVFPQGLEKEDGEPEVRRTLRLAYEEWADNQEGTRPEQALHYEWLRFVLGHVLEIPRTLLFEGQALPASLRAFVPEHSEMLQPDIALVSPDTQTPRLLIVLYANGQDLEKPVAGRRWTASPATRMMELLRRTGTRLGLVTNGRYWMLVDAPPSETTGFATWDAELWNDEPLTLRAFRNLLGARRFFGVPDNETLEAMLTESAKNQQEVTDRLGYQVREAVELLVRSLDMIDKEQQRSLLVDVSESALYEATLTVMMRLVFLLSAEERGLLRLGELLYDRYYAVSTLQATLREQADLFGEEVLERRHDAWVRLLAIFRVIYGGIEHQDLRLPAYGGHLFDPDRFPFLEGRPSATSWHETPAQPIPLNNRTVLHLLEALQFLQMHTVRGEPAERRRLSFRALDVEQIGHVYEGLLDHTVRRAPTPILGISGAKGSDVELALAEIEQFAKLGEQALLSFLQDQTGRSVDTLKKSLATSPIPKRFSRADLLTACDGSATLFEQVLPFVGLLRSDSFDKPVVVPKGSLYVTQGTDRRSTGTHYTPKSLTEPIVQHTLDPLVYIGPAEGKPQEEWQLRSAADILKLKVCDMAMGSGAFLVQTCRYLAEKLVEAWDIAGQQQVEPPFIAPEGRTSTGAVQETLLPKDTAERLALALRLVSEQCVYGVDKNPLAVEMAKLSLWLITLNKNKPFTFLDHALRLGDSLLGVNLTQLTHWSMSDDDSHARQLVWAEPLLKDALNVVLRLRRRILALPDDNVQHIEQKEQLLAEAGEAMALVKLGADLLIVGTLRELAPFPKGIGKTIDLPTIADYANLVSAYQEARRDNFTDEGRFDARTAFQQMREQVDHLLGTRRPFHWPLEFPEVFATETNDERGFSAIISNPPFQGGQKITGTLGTDYRDYLVEYLAHGKRGSADLCAYFFLKASQLVCINGQCGLLATNTIAQGDTREVGLDQLIASGWTIPRAIASHKWPGEAGLEVAQIWFRNGRWEGVYTLNDIKVSYVTSYLTTARRVEGSPYSLNASSGKSFLGSYVLGKGFVLEPEEALALLKKDEHNRDVLLPYLNGEDITSRFDQSPSRWVINFYNWPLEKAQAYTDCIEIVRKKVKPERDLNNIRSRRETWWQYAGQVSNLYSTIKDMRRVLVIPFVSKYMACVWEKTNIIYAHPLIIIATQSNADFALIQCTFHSDWARANGSTLETRMRYTPTDCFETFPFPNNMQQLDNIGERYYQHRQSIMLARQEGLTKTYNRFHDEQGIAEDIVRLRALHREMDEAVAHAYEWDDLALEHGFHQTKQGIRYTISEGARREVLDRLLQLNHERYAEEVALGLHEKGAKNGKGKKSGVAKQNNIDKNENVQYTTLFD